MTRLPNLVQGIDNVDHEVLNYVKAGENRLRHIRRLCHRRHPPPGIHSPTMIKAFSAIFISVFLAEIGDKTQLATMLFASEAQNNKWLVFAASATALVLASAIGVLVGAQLERFVKPSTLKLIAGAGFIVIGLWTMLSRG
jgi:putative Ca2+/H+ antiporter (TMEM165/GDT1 family)